MIPTLSILLGAEVLQRELRLRVPDRALPRGLQGLHPRLAAPRAARRHGGRRQSLRLPATDGGDGRARDAPRLHVRRAHVHAEGTLFSAVVKFKRIDMRFHLSVLYGTLAQLEV